MNAEEFLIYIALVSCMAVFIALATASIKKIFGNKLSPAFHYYIWVVFVLRLVFPFSLENDMSIYNIPAGVYKNITASPERPLVENSNAGNEITIQKNNIIAGILTKQNAAGVIFPIYLSGFIFYAAAYFTKYIKYKRKIIKSCCPAADDELILFEQIKSKLGVTKNIRLLKGETSLLIGILSPAVILSRDCAENEKSIVMAHELVHYKRKDNLTNIILSVIKYIYWFNPLIHFFMRRIKNDMEILCDMKSIKLLQCEKEKYAVMLLNSSDKNYIKVPAAVNVSEKGKHLMYRLNFISKYKKPGIIASFIAIAFMAVLAVTALTNPIAAWNIDPRITITEIDGILHESMQYEFIPEYTIKHIDGDDYMFVQWKSGDYTIRKQKPHYYVFRKQ